jgi:cbb3-type cytochrome oxidase maturation protein
MSVLFILIAASMLIAGGFLAAFIWSVRDGQYEDDYTPSARILFEPNPKTESNSNQNNKQQQKPKQHANGEILL